ncbi:hypothetical protein CYK68_10995 [Clostridium perfringens]|nr:hypothetical protein CYK68_10995 [Clostridium perfringens]
MQRQIQSYNLEKRIFLKGTRKIFIVLYMMLHYLFLVPITKVYLMH